MQCSFPRKRGDRTFALAYWDEWPRRAGRKSGFWTDADPDHVRGDDPAAFLPTEAERVRKLANVEA